MNHNTLLAILLILPVGDNRFMVIICTLGLDSSKVMEGVVTDYQCLPTSHGEGALYMEGSGCTQVKDRNKSLQMMIYSVLHIKGVVGLPIMNMNTRNMKNIQTIHTYRLKLVDKQDKLGLNCMVIKA